MPWCVTCDRYLSPSTVKPDGTCRTCGKPVEAGVGGTVGGSAGTAPTKRHHETDDSDEQAALPWHLWALLAALVIYLGFRFWQGVEALWNWAL